MSKNKIDNIVDNIIILYHEQHLKEKKTGGQVTTLTRC